jgi:hypothetical protein
LITPLRKILNLTTLLFLISFFIVETIILDFLCAVTLVNTTKQFLCKKLNKKPKTQPAGVELATIA